MNVRYGLGVGLLNFKLLDLYSFQVTTGFHGCREVKGDPKNSIFWVLENDPYKFIFENAQEIHGITESHGKKEKLYRAG